LVAERLACAWCDPTDGAPAAIVGAEHDDRHAGAGAGELATAAVATAAIIFEVRVVDMAVVGPRVWARDVALAYETKFLRIEIE
jgi:hypothetical protein